MAYAGKLNKFTKTVKDKFVSMIGRASPKDLEPALDAMTKHLDDFDIDELIDAKEANERFLIRAARLKIKRGANHGAVGELVEAPYQGWTTAYKIRPKKN